jgi:hypothetical protein
MNYRIHSQYKSKGKEPKDFVRFLALKCEELIKQAKDGQTYSFATNSQFDRGEIYEHPKNCGCGWIHKV